MLQDDGESRTVSCRSEGYSGGSRSSLVKQGIVADREQEQVWCFVQLHKEDKPCRKLRK